MHRLWEIEEMVRLLATHLEKQHGASASAVALACCSKRLTDAVLDSVWEELRGLDLLMKCFPPETWEIDPGGEFDFIRHPSSKEWARFSSYARRVRTFDLLEGRGVSWTAFYVLSMRAPTLGHYPLPNLRSACLETYQWALVPFLRLFLNPGLANVHIGFPNSDEHLYRPVIVSSIPTSNLTRLKLSNMGSGDSFSGELHDLLDEASESLRSFSLDGELSTEIIEKLLQLHNLRRLDVRLLQAEISPPTVLSPFLEELDVTFIGSSPEYLQILGSSLLDANPERTLTSIKCTSRVTTPLTEAGIRPLLLFRKLTTLELSASCKGGQCGIQLDDSTIFELAISLPHLTSLGLGDVPCRASTSNVTVESLVALSTNCVGLDFLRLHFDAKDITTRDAHTNSQTHKFTCKLRTLSVGSQPLPSNRNDILLVMFTILNIFPHVETILSTEEGWNQVKEGIEVFRKAPQIVPLPGKK